ncbi:hypothetical protein NPIL_373711 [Nephila pilipes]|uniref:Uncharacterized protein n=1 Tax=Nephila pilipes TaxID=299642 RepID=A0A8X6NZE1_NEPPI|nr:hypothetical protein NPIL_373711 [Nephila pilipes]
MRNTDGMPSIPEGCLEAEWDAIHIAASSDPHGSCYVVPKASFEDIYFVCKCQTLRVRPLLSLDSGNGSMNYL